MDKPPKNPWDYFPLIMCVNLRERDDRLEEAKQELRKAGLNQVTFFRTDRQPDRDKAIIDSHMSCLRHAVEANVPYVLVFEDDVLFQPGIVENMTRVVQFLQTRDDWKIFYLGGFIFRKVERIDRNILRGGILTTHGYVMRTDFAREVLARRPFCSGMSIDLFYSVLLGNAGFVHVNPLVCIQRPSQSDGTWDKRSLNKEGWLGNAMLYTAEDWSGRLKFKTFSVAERIRVQNGIAFFNVFRQVLRRRFAKAESRGKGLPAPPLEPDRGVFVTEILRS